MFILGGWLGSFDAYDPSIPVGPAHALASSRVISNILDIDLSISDAAEWHPRRNVMATVLSLGPEPVQPTEEVSSLAADASRRLFRLIAANLRETCVVRFESAPDEPVVLPAAAVRLLGALLTELAKGNAVTLMPHHAELTTQEAADLLNVSRPFLVSILESGQLPHHKVGTHRRVRFADLMIYKRRRDAQSEAALRELAALSQDMKLDT
jgi:excisionase family DNA binding protein